MLDRDYYVYIMANKKHGTIYTGITNDLIRRVWQHKNKYFSNSFTAKYNLGMLVYYEQTNDVVSAIEREKQIKNGSRQKKIDLIDTFNPEWNDLYDAIK